jgi:hypothetical protein
MTSAVSRQLTGQITAMATFWGFESTLGQPVFSVTGKAHSLDPIRAAYTVCLVAFTRGCSVAPTPHHDPQGQQRSFRAPLYARQLHQDALPRASDIIRLSVSGLAIVRLDG